MSQNLAFKWLGPYRILDAVKEKGTYLLKELDGSRMAGTFAGDTRAAQKSVRFLIGLVLLQSLRYEQRQPQVPRHMPTPGLCWR